MKIKYNTLMDYIKCPAYYKFKHVNKLTPEGIMGREYIWETLLKTVYYFYNTIKDENRIPKETEIKEYWAELYVEKEDELLFKDTSLKRNQLDSAHEFLKKFYIKHQYNPGIPVGVDVRYSIRIGNHEIEDGYIQLIRVMDGKVQIVYFDNGTYFPDDFRIKNDMRFTLMAYAYRHIFKEKENEFLYTHIRKGREMNVYRKQSDFNKLIRMLDNIGNAIENNLYWQKINHLCKSCPYSEACTNWDGR